MNANRDLASASYDTVIYGGTIVTVNPDTGIIENGWIGIRDGRLEQIAALSAGAPPPQGRRRIDATGHLVVPGLVNTHTHLPMTLFRGLADDLPLAQWLQRHIFPAEAAHMSAENVSLGALLGCIEMIRSGTTACCDGYFLEEYVAEAAHAAGIRAVLGQGVVDFPAPGVPNPALNVAAAAEFVERWQNRSSKISPSIFCHSPYACSEQTLRKAKQNAAETGALFQIHLAETRTETEAIRREHGCSPVEYLQRLDLLDHRSLLVHCVWLDEKDAEIIARSGAAVSHNPDSNAKLGCGIAPLPALQSAGVTVGIGSDGCASNNTLDLFRTLDFAAKLHKVHSGDPTAAAAENLLRMATIEGARALGLEKQIGSLEIGKRADLVLVDLSRPHLVPLYRPASHLVYTARGGDVAMVLIDGKIVCERGRMTSVDTAETVARARKAGEAIQRWRTRQKPAQE